MTERFLDTDLLLYLLSSDPLKADRAEELVSAGGILSVQVLNEFASVASRKLKMSVEEIPEVLTVIRAVCRVVPISEQTHDLGLQFAERYRLSIYDSSEDMQDGQTFDESLKVRNPFRGSSGPGA